MNEMKGDKNMRDKVNFKKKTNLNEVKKSAKGITLIALVITIIVLLILAGVSIATLTGDNGILTQANNAKNENIKGQEKEAIGLAWQSLRLDRQANNNTDPITDTELKEQLVTNGEDSNNLEVTGGTGKLTVKYKDSGNSYTIDQNGNIENGTDTGDGGDTGEDTTPDGVTVPDGFYPVEGTTVEEGFVISDVEGDDLNNSKGGNQFVWIPVDDINEMAKLTSGNDANGNPNYQGKLYGFTSTGSTEKTNYGQGTTSYREPDILSSYDGKSENLDIIKGILTNQTDKYTDMDTFKKTMQEDYNEMVKSVEKYHGFYIGRYEMSKSSSNTAQSKSKSAALTATTSSANTWYGLYAYGKTYTNEKNSVVSSMVWGSQYDAMLRWLQKNGEDVTSTTVPNGGSKNTDQTYTGPEKDTDLIKNIYDIYGGRHEWSLEASDTYFRVHRGGYYNYSYSPSYRSSIDYPYFTDSYYSSRLTLYVK